MVYMYHSFLIHSFTDGHLGCFHVLAIINSVMQHFLEEGSTIALSIFSKPLLAICKFSCAYVSNGIYIMTFTH